MIELRHLGEHYPCSQIILALVNGEPAGILGLKGGEWGGAHDLIDIVYVTERNLRKGVATAMIKQARADAGGEVFHDGVLSPKGRRLLKRLQVERKPFTGNNGGVNLSQVDANRAGAQLFLWAIGLGQSRWADRG